MKMLILLFLLFLYPDSAYAVSFETVQDLWVNGNAGIGTTAPSEKLEVGGGNVLITGKSAVSSTTWTDVMGTPATIGSVYSLAVYNGQLYVGDRVAASSGNVYRYDGGTTWTDVMGTPANTYGVWCLAVYNDKLYAGDENGNIWRYDGGTTWTDVMGTPATIGVVLSLVVYNGQLYAGDSVGNVYRYDSGTTWTDVMGTPASINQVDSLAVYNGQLYAGDYGGNVYRYDGGTTWTDVMGTPATVNGIYALTVYNGQLYAGDGSVGGSDNVWRYDGGTTWTDVMGSPATLTVIYALAVYNGQLYATEKTSGVGNVYRYDGGTTWTDVMGTPASIGTDPHALAVYNGQIYIGDYAGNVWQYTANPLQSYALKFKSDSELASLWFRTGSSAQGNESQNQHGQFIFSHGIITNSGGYDIAEDFVSLSPALGPGELVSLGLSAPSHIIPSTSGYQRDILGVISTKPGLRLSGEDALNPEQKPVVLMGRTPVKVSLENGPIAIGDYLTSSSIPGVAMKATQPGRVIGMALEPFHSPTQGEIMVFVNPHWYGGEQDKNGITRVQELTAEKLTTKEARIDKLEMIDQATGEVYCTWVENGKRIKVKGKCSCLTEK